MLLADARGQGGNDCKIPLARRTLKAPLAEATLAGGGEGQGPSAHVSGSTGPMPDDTSAKRRRASSDRRWMPRGTAPGLGAQSLAVTIERREAATDPEAGRILNAKTARSQCLGAMIFSIGTALTEALAHDARDDWTNPLQAKRIGELGIYGAAAAITNAIYNACGVRVRDEPATLDKVLAGMDRNER